MPDHDPFADLKLDDDFVAGASAREMDGESRARRAAQEAQWQAEMDARHEAHRRERRLRTRAWRFVAGTSPAQVLVLSLAIAGAAWWGLARWERATEPRPASLTSDASGETMIAADEAWPTPALSIGKTRLGVPRLPPAEAGTYQFQETQPGSAAPVAYDPCREIPVVVNRRAMPPGGEGLLADAMAEVSQLTGLQFRVEGPTDEAPSGSREPFQKSRYGDRWAPVLVAWSDPVEYAELVGDVAGTGGSGWVDRGNGKRVYATGQLALDGPQLAELLQSREGEAQARATVLHELGHLVGLAHVNDGRELMHPQGDASRVTWGPGDLHGLAQLGAGACVEKL